MSKSMYEHLDSENDKLLKKIEELEAKLKSKDDHISQLGKKVDELEIKLNRTRKNVFFGM